MRKVFVTTLILKLKLWIQQHLLSLGRKEQSNVIHSIMNLYYVNNNPQKNGDYEVHKSDCRYLPGFINRKFLGYFSNCKEAVKKAQETHKQSNGCKTCCPEYHTS